MTGTSTRLLVPLLLVWATTSHAGESRTLSFAINPNTPDLQCPAAPASPPAPAPVPAAPVEDPEVVPDADDLGDLARDVTVAPPALDPLLIDGFAVRRDAAGVLPLRIGIWGDSHMATGVFAGELAKGIAARGAEVDTDYLPPTMGRSGVRLPIRKHCMGTTWRLEPAYTSARGATVGPSLVNLRSTRRGSYLWIDFRDDARASRIGRVRVMYLPTPTLTTLGVTVDGGMEQRIRLARTSPGDAIRTSDLDIGGPAPLSTIKLRVIEGTAVLQGFMLTHRDDRPVTMNVFGLPSATMRGWAQTDAAYMKDALRGTTYDAVILEYGTNEGNDRDFDKVTYAAGLSAALQSMRAVFPDAACLLIGPTDRGIRIRKPAPGRARRTPAAPPDLLKYSRIHRDITEVQAEVGRRYRCSSWDWQAYMGGPGAAYRWALKTPALAARDLTHLNPGGYRQSAAALARALGWAAEP